MFKTNSEVIKIEAKKINPINTGVVFWSHDRGTAKLKFKLMKDNLPQPIPDGTTVPIRLTFSSPTSEGGIGKHDYLATIEDKIGGIVSITLQDNILGYQGIVHGSIYMDFPGNTSLDTAGRFSFEIQRSPIDETTPELEDYYFNGFSKVIDQVEQLIDDTNKRIDDLNTEIDKANGALDRIEDEIKESAGMTEKFINSIDFGDYDYSGNPNLMNNLSFSDFAVQAGGGTISDGGKFLKINKTSGTNLFVMAGYKNSTYYLTPVLSNTTYTITYTLRKSSNFVPKSGKRVILRYRLNQNDVTNNLGELILDSTNVTAEFTTYTKTFTTGELVNPNRYYFQALVEEGLSGEIELSYEIKLEKGSTATSYQPNLLDAPYYLSNVPLGENLCDPTVKFPITSSVETLYSGRAPEDFVEGETYTVTIGATKPSTQSLGVYLALKNQTIFKPVEGLPNTWTATLKIDILGEKKNTVYIFQSPKSSVGACQIDWLKIEKGDTRTPNIDRLRYKGIGVTKNSINKYLWEENTLLEKVYTNSLDFGNYDYSGNPNLMPNLDFSKLSRTNYTIQTPLPYVKDGGTHFVLDASDASAANTSRNVFIPFLGRLEKGATYVVTIPMMVSEDFGTDYVGSQIYPYNVNDGTITTRALNMTPNDDCRGKWQFIKQAFTVPSNMPDGKFAPYLHVWQNTNQTGKLYIGYDIKIEKVNSTSDTATPYQPNLLDEPYWVGKAPLGDNLMTGRFPVSNSQYAILGRDIKKPFEVGKTYTATLKGTKPSTQTFVAYSGGTVKFGEFKPVEGLTDIWSVTFTVSNLSNSPANFSLYQQPQSTIGAVQIDWLKLEKGDTRTPNISDYKYIGEKSIYSNDYKNINWDVTENYIDNKFNIMVDTVNPQSIGGTKNFLETPFVNNSPIVYDENPLPFEAWYSQAKEVRPCSHKSRLPIGRELTNIGKTRRRLMKDNPLQWNSGQWEAQVLRDCILLIEGTVILEFGSNSGIWTYIDVWNDTAQTSIIGEGAGTGVGDPSKLWFRNEVAFSRYVVLSKGTQLSIGTSMPEGKQLTKAVMRSMHIMEIDIE